MAMSEATLGQRYRLEVAIGRGGMATVYLADDIKHDRKVAVKWLKSSLATDDVVADYGEQADRDQGHPERGEKFQHRG